MSTLKITTSAQWATEKTVNGNNLIATILGYIDSQASSGTLWFLVSLMTQGVLFLPIPAVLIYYYHAPVVILAATLTLFFANIIGGMSGAGIRFIMLLFAVSALIHLAMLAVFIL